MFERSKIGIDPDDQLAAQPGAIKSGLTSSRKIQIESKEEMRKRGMPSHDHVDATSMTLVEGVTIQVRSTMGRLRR